MKFNIQIKILEDNRLEIHSFQAPITGIKMVNQKLISLMK